MIESAFHSQAILVSCGHFKSLIAVMSATICQFIANKTNVDDSTNLTGLHSCIAGSCIIASRFHFRNLRDKDHLCRCSVHVYYLGKMVPIQYTTLVTMGHLMHVDI